MSKKRRFHFGKQLLGYISRGQNDEAKAMLNKDLCSVLDDFGTLLHHATNFQNDVIIRHLIELGSDIDSQESFSLTPLIIAVDNNSVAGVKVLLEAGANIDIIDDLGRSPLRLALSVENFVVEIVEAFFERLRSENLPIEDFVERLMKAECSLYHAAYLRDVKVIEHMLKRGISIDSQGVDGKTALHAAVELYDPQLAQMLIDNGADVNAVDEEYESVLFLAAKKGNSEMVALLLNNGADAEIGRTDSHTPMNQVFENATVETQEQYYNCATLLLQGSYSLMNSRRNLSNSTLMSRTLMERAAANQCDRLFQLLFSHLVLIVLILCSEFGSTQLPARLDDALFHTGPTWQLQYYRKCLRINEIPIIGKLTLFDFVRYRQQKLRVHMRDHRFNHMVTNFCEVHRLKEEHSYYYRILEKGLMKANERAALEKKAIPVLSRIFNEGFDILDGLSLVIAEKVVEYLNDNDIRKLTQVYTGNLKQIY